MGNKNVFFLDTTEGENLTELRECVEIGRYKDNFRDDYLLVEVVPPLIGQNFGLGGHDIDKILLATRHQGQTLCPISEWPSFVYVIRVIDESIIKKGEFTEDQVELILWGVLYKTQDDAKKGF